MIGTSPLQMMVAIFFVFAMIVLNGVTEVLGDVRIMLFIERRNLAAGRLIPIIVDIILLAASIVI